MERLEEVEMGCKLLSVSVNSEVAKLRLVEDRVSLTHKLSERCFQTCARWSFARASR